MQSEFMIIKKRKELATGLKEIVDYMNESNKSLKNEEKMITAIKGGTVMVRMLDWMLNKDDIEFEDFCKKTDDSFAKEFGLDKISQF